MKGKMKSIHGIYKKHGREAFLQAARSYSNHVSDTVDDTLSEMESRWYDADHTLTEADKMVADYNNGLTMLNDPQMQSGPEMAQVEMKM